MLKVIIARENLNKEKYAFENIGDEAIIIVPEQYTLEAEKDALKYKKRQGIAETQVISFSRLGTKIFKAVGAFEKELLDKQGRHILLTKILKDNKEKLEIFKNQESKNSFIEMTNNLISQMKTNNISSEELGQIQAELEEDSFLKKKLKDINTIYSEYEKTIESKYTDSEDYIDLYIERIKEWEVLKEKEILIYGFDYFTPKNLLVIKELLVHCDRVTVLLSGADERAGIHRDSDIFAITNRMRERLEDIALEVGKKFEEIYVTDEYEIPKEKPLIHLEKELFALPSDKFDGKAENITLLKAANYYLEAESAATYMLYLIREKGLNLSDIAIICNDLSTRGDIYKRVFTRYGINIFLDEKSGITNAPLIRYILTLLEIKAKGFRREDVIKLIKTGLTDVEDYEEIESLEQFAAKYNIRGNKWKTVFPVWEEDEEEYTRAESAREKVVAPILKLFDELDKKKTVKENIDILYGYIRNSAKILQKMEAYVEELKKEGQNKEALFQAQVYETVIKVFEQVIEVVGEEKLSVKEIKELIESGFEAVALATVPPTADMSILGTVQRTRTGEIKALFLLGANEGIVPKEIGDVELLSEEEKEYLTEKDVNLLKLKKLKREEEELALYKMMAKPTEFLWVSYAVSDGEGEQLKAASVFEKIEEIFPEVEIVEDIENRRDDMSLISSEKSTMYFLAKKLREKLNGKEIEPIWLEVAKWYKENKNEEFERMKRGLSYQNKAEKINDENVKKLYENNTRISPSSIEKYARCPFSHFIRYILRPKEERNFNLSNADVGTIYHELLMTMAQRLTTENVPITLDNSKWMTITKEESDEMAKDILREISNTYRKGLVSADPEEENKAELMAVTCMDSAWAMIKHVKQGEIKDMMFEQAFGRNKVIEPVEIKVDDEKVFCIEGKIDRVDMLPDDYVKVIDYKSSNLKFNKEKAVKGWTVQLLLYLEAATNTRNIKRKPAGTFYFHIDSPIIDATLEGGEDVMDKFWAEFRMDGVMLNEKTVLGYIDQTLKDAGSKSNIIKAEIKKDNTVSEKNKNLLNKEEFEILRKEVYGKVEEICKSIWEGNIDIEPTQVGKGSTVEKGCKYCDYRAICKKEASEA